MFLAKYTPPTGKPLAVAVKAMNNDEDFDEDSKRLFLLEAQIMAEFQHPNSQFAPLCLHLCVCVCVCVCVCMNVHERV